MMLLPILAARAADPAPKPATNPATTAPDVPTATRNDGVPYLISSFKVTYNRQNSQLPRIEEIVGMKIELGQVADGYIVPPRLERRWLQVLGRTDENQKPHQVPTVTVRLVDFKNDANFYSSALWAIDEQIRAYLNKKNIIGVYAQPAGTDISTDPKDPGTDLRKDRTTMELVIYTGVVDDVRTVASGDRIPLAERINHPWHNWIRVHSPVQKAGQGGGGLLRRDELDNYVYRLNRQPGRHVDVAVSGASAEKPGAVVLDYLITEAKPWSVYAQLSNTGTKQTNEWRERFGFVENQLTNHDDILSLDYTTASFSKSHSVNASYDTPLGSARRVRGRIYGDYSQFTASDVGFGRENFDGNQYDAGGEVALNVYQKHDFFIDLVAGGRYEHVRVNNRTLGVNTTGSADFAVPYGGLRLERISEVSSTVGEAMLLGRITNASTAELNKLGRLNADRTAVVFQGNLTHAFFLEPLLDPSKFEAAKSTLAHEIVLSVRGQYAFSNRLIPEAEEVAGGLYSVRGYPESVVSGDSAIIASAEYRFHIPRSLPVNPVVNINDPNPLNKPFKFRPQQAYGRPDWDLLVRGFLDVGQTYNSHATVFEKNETLIGTGLGIELDIRQNVSLRADWGVPLKGIPGGPDAGSSRFYFSATFLY
jgi:hemolysin activation/secretion protein